MKGRKETKCREEDEVKRREDGRDKDREGYGRTRTKILRTRSTKQSATRDLGHKGKGKTNYTSQRQNENGSRSALRTQ